MKRQAGNSQMFALRSRPAESILIAGATYRLTKVFKHDFWAATCLYELTAGQDSDTTKIVVKFGREQGFCGLPLAWTGSVLRAHEEANYRALAGVVGVPRWIGRLGQSGYAIDFIEGRPLDHPGPLPVGFFGTLRTVFDAVHARGIAYCDANKRSNILVGPAGRPFLVDYQISIRRLNNLPWPLRQAWNAVVAYFARKDIYHLYKHKRRMCPEQLTPEEDTLSRPAGLLHRLHRKLTKPYRALRRGFLSRQYRKGLLDSPTAELEHHPQPEKESWRKD
jgi:hypothetical protein